MCTKLNIFNAHGNLVSQSPLIMGILNVTPDSFYDGGKFYVLESAKNKIDEMVKEGVDIVDVGGVSTRPNAAEVSLKEELNRVLPVLEYIREKYPDQLVSLDTYRSEVLAKAMEFKVNVLNDVSFGKFDDTLLPAVAEYKIPYVLMHMQGTPQDMQKNPKYDNVNLELISFFKNALYTLKSLGIKDVLLDPGFGFGKTVENNYAILRHLSSFEIFDCPILVGLSRKSMIYKFLEIDKNDALSATTALHLYALNRGANILRVHDTTKAKEAVQLFKMLKK